MMKAENIVGNFDDFLQEDWISDEASRVAIKLSQEMKAQTLTESAMAQ